MNETAIAFEPPHVRAAASEPASLDRISVRDYVRVVEIGAFASERGVTQRVRFNVVLEVAHPGAAATDDVDQVISYDSLTRAIDAELGAGRVNLLETLAERVAERCLADPRAVRAFVRVEKLDRGPGALGVELVRRRAARAPAIVPREAEPAPSVVFLAAGVLAGVHAQSWLDAAAAAGCVVVPGPAATPSPARGEATLRAGLLAIDQAAWTLAAADSRFSVVASRTELAWGARERRPMIWAPMKLVADAVVRPAADASQPEALALWLAGTIGAACCIFVGGSLPPPPHPVPSRVLDPGAATTLAAELDAAAGEETRHGGHAPGL